MPWSRCHLVAGRPIGKLKVRDFAHGNHIMTRAIVMQQKAQRPVQFEISAPTRKFVLAWIRRVALKSEDYLFLSRLRHSAHWMSLHEILRMTANLPKQVAGCVRARLFKIWRTRVLYCC
jgi:hypothetical protein